MLKIDKEKHNLSYRQGIKTLSNLLFTTIGNTFHAILVGHTPLHNVSEDTLDEGILNWKSLYLQLGNGYGFASISHEKISQFLENYRPHPRT